MAIIPIGSEAPDFTLPRDGGQTIVLAEFKGRNTVLFFYPKDDTTGCTKEAIAFSLLRDEFAAENTVVIGISADSPAKHDKFKEKHGLTVHLASDEEHVAIAAYGVWVEKNMYGRKYMGIERASYLIDAAGNVAQIWRKVKVAGHAEAVLAEVKRINR
jgi:peroxiredoxin Q/BCP